MKDPQIFLVGTMQGSVLCRVQLREESAALDELKPEGHQKDIIKVIQGWGEVDAFTSFCNVSISSCQPFIVARYNKLCVLCIALYIIVYCIIYYT